MTNLQKILGGIGAALLVFGLGFGTAMYTRPAKVIEKEVIKEVKVQDEAWAQTKIEEYKKTHKEEFTVTKWKKVQVEVPCPTAPTPVGGCTPPCVADCNLCPKQIISIDSGSTAGGTITDGTTGTATTNTTGTSTTTTTTDTERTKITIYEKPQWILSLKGGIDLSSPSSLTSQPITDFLLLGAEVDRRILGPVFVGIWANSNLKSTLSTGLSLSLEL
jgi:hypothetical protein